MLSKPILLNNFKRSLGMNEDYLINEGISSEALTLHTMFQCGQNKAQDFIDDNKIDPKKLMEYLRVNPDKKMVVKDYICGTGDKKHTQKFIKEIK